MDKKTFTKEFIKNRKTIGSVRPSSKFLTKKMLKAVPFHRDLVIVELGPGTGVFTKRIIKSMTADSKLFVFEVNDEFYDNLQKQITDPRVILIHDSAENIKEHLSKHQVKDADVVLSSLPLANFGEDLSKRIIRAAKNALRKNGRYVQFQYTLQAKNILESEFKKVQTGFTLLNVPPAFVYYCIR